MKKKRLNGLSIVLIISLLINALQFIQMKDYIRQEKSYTEMFEESFSGLIDSFSYLHGTSSLSNESAIKNSAKIVEHLSTIRVLTSYKNDKEISEMLHYLSRFFVLSSGNYINDNLSSIIPSLEDVSNNLNDKNKIKILNIELWEVVKSQDR